MSMPSPASEVKVYQLAVSKVGVLFTGKASGQRGLAHGSVVARVRNLRTKRHVVDVSEVALM